MRSARLLSALLLTSLFMVIASPTAQAADPNSAAIAVNDHYMVVQGQTLTVDAPGVLSNDSDPDGDPIHVGGVNQPFSHAEGGTGGIFGDGHFTYTPEAGFLGDDIAIYKAYDEEPFPSAEATITVTVVAAAPANSAPVAVADHYTVTEGETLTVPAPGLLANDSDPEGDTMYVGYDPSSFPHATSFDFGINGNLTYTPEPGFTGDDIGLYRAYDDDNPSGTIWTQVTVTVKPAETPSTPGADTPGSESDETSAGALPEVGASASPWLIVIAGMLITAGVAMVGRARRA